MPARGVIMTSELSSRAWDLRAPDDPAPWRQGLPDRFLQLSAGRRPGKEAVRFAGRSITYAELDALANQTANGLLALGARPGDVIGVVAENDLDVFGLLYGIARAGMAVLPMNPKSTREDITAQMEETGAKLLVASGDLTVSDLAAKGHDGPPDVEGDESRFFHVRFTSGTTGRPKVIAATHRAIASLHESTARELRYCESDVALVSAPVAHAAFHIAASTILAGGTIVLEHDFDALHVWETCDRHQVTQAYLAPTMFALAMASPGSGASLKGLLALSAAFPLALKEKVWERFPNVEVFEAYGATELGLVTLLRPTDPASKQGSVGLPAFGFEVRVLDPEGRVVSPHEVGEVYVRGPAMSFGYVGTVPMRPDQARDGWVSAGDMGFMDEDGYLYIADRRDDLVVSGGLNVYPAEVEAVLLRAEGVDAVAVLGIPDDTWGHVVVAAVQGSATEEQLDAHCRAALARYKVPRRYVFLDELPRNENGKTLRRVLRDQLAATTERRR
jgi:long-chain acyl-CoA synthetase